MSLSQDHQDMLRRIQAWCIDRDKLDDHYVTLHNENPLFHGGTPIPIRGSIPDLTWKNRFNSYRFIGEAKTYGDVRNDHTKKQLKAFLTELEKQDFGELVFGVPFTHEAQAKNILFSVTRKLGFKTQRWQVITDLNYG